MPHRSIIRINRNQSRRGGHKIISLVCLYIILSIIFSDSNKRVYFIISFSIVFSAVCFYICIVRNKTIIDTQDISDIDSSIEDSTDYISDDDIINIHYTHSPEMCEMITAVPISPSNIHNSSDITIFATPIEE
jgi:predicted Na+-dependent transporter